MKFKSKAIAVLSLTLLLAGCHGSSETSSSSSSSSSASSSVIPSSISSSSSFSSSSSSSSSSVVLIPSDKGYIPEIISKFDVSSTKGYVEDIESRSGDTLVSKKTATLVYDFEKGTGSEHDVVKELGEFSLEGDGYTTSEEDIIYDSTKGTFASFVGMDLASWNITVDNISSSSEDSEGKVHVTMVDSYTLGENAVHEFIFTLSGDKAINYISYSWANEGLDYIISISFSY